MTIFAKSRTIQVLPKIPPAVVEIFEVKKFKTKNIMHTLPEKIGIVNELVSYMQNPDNQTALTAKNFDPTPHIARLQGKLKSVGDLSSEQKQLEVQKQNKTAQVQAAAYDAYNDASGTLDAMIGLLGKGSTEARKLQTIRSRVRNHNDTNPPAPAPAAK